MVSEFDFHQRKGRAGKALLSEPRFAVRAFASLDLGRDMVSVAVTANEFAVFSSHLRFLIVVLASALAVGPLLAQEAIETPKPSAEVSPEATPAKKDTKPARSLEETMRPEEFKAAGLDKLSEDEMQHLDAYLQGYRAAAQKKAAEQAQSKAQDEIKKANAKADEANAKADEAQKVTEEAKRDAATAKTEAASARTKLDALSSRVDGTIDGIKGHTQIRLEDGTVWKQVNLEEHFHATVTDHPAAVVLHTPFGYKMRIEGMPEFYVNPVR